MKKNGIICAMDNEFALIKQALAHGRTAQIGRCTFYCAEYAGKDIIAATGGIGKVNAAACAQMMISNFGVECIVFSGVAGALSDKLHIFDIIVANDVMYHDLFPASLLRDNFPNCDCFPTDARLAELAETVCTELGLHCIRGRVVSGDQFITDSIVKARIISDTHGDATEMEGAAVGHVCYLNNLPFAILRCISDGADDNGEMDFDTFVEQAAHRCAKLTLGLVERI